MKNEKIIEIVDSLNNKFCTLVDYDFPPFAFSTDGFSQTIHWFQDVVWCSENDEREYNEELDEFEFLEDYIIKIVCERARKTLKVFG